MMFPSGNVREGSLLSFLQEIKMSRKKSTIIELIFCIYIFFFKSNIISTFVCCKYKNMYFHSRFWFAMRHQRNAIKRESSEGNLRSTISDLRLKNLKS